MHKKQERQRGLNDRDNEHPHEHLRRADVLIGNEELYPCQGQYADVDDKVFFRSITLRFGGSHRSCLPLSVFQWAKFKRYTSGTTNIQTRSTKCQYSTVISRSSAL